MIRVLIEPGHSFNDDDRILKEEKRYKKMIERFRITQNDIGASIQEEDIQKLQVKNIEDYIVENTDQQLVIEIYVSHHQIISQGSDVKDIPTI